MCDVTHSCVCDVSLVRVVLFMGCECDSLIYVRARCCVCDVSLTCVVLFYEALTSIVSFISNEPMGYEQHYGCDSLIATPSYV